jgi:hypothetical protein
MVRANKDKEAEYPQYENKTKEESLESYYMRQQGSPNRNEVIPTWRKPPEDRNAEPEAFDFETGYGPKNTHNNSKSETFAEGQDCNPSDQRKPEPGSVPSHSRNFGRKFSGNAP